MCKDTKSTNELDTLRAYIEERLPIISAKKLSDLTPSSEVLQKIKMKDRLQVPMPQKTRLVPESRKIEFHEQLKEQLAAGIIAPSSSPWSSPPHLIIKDDGSLRITVDYKKLNELTEKDAFPIPNVDDLYRKLSKSKVFTKLDFLSVFYQILLDPASRKFTTFSCDWGLFEYLVMPMGLCNSPATFQRLMTSVLQDFIEEGFVVVYMDDILIYSSSIDEHKRHVDRVIERLIEKKLKIKRSKCDLAKPSV